MKIGVAIPCYSGHIPHLYELLNSIENQTKLPDKVVVSCSSTNNLDLKKTYKFELEILTTPDKLNASQNRNKAISRLLDMDYITMIDADDIMHPQRIYALLKIFETYDVDVILHHFTFNNNFTLFEDIDVRINTLIKQSNWCGLLHSNSEYNSTDYIHHAQITFKRHVFDKVKYPEDSQFCRLEDSVFCSMVFGLENINNAYIKNALSYYRPSNTQF